MLLWVVFVQDCFCTLSIYHFVVDSCKQGFNAQRKSLIKLLLREEMFTCKLSFALILKEATRSCSVRWAYYQIAYCA